MAEINNSLAASVNSSPLDLTKTLGTISQIELAQAHAGLFGLQSQQEARKLYANKAIQEYGLTPEGITEFAKRGGDPAAIEMYQKGYGTGNALSQTGGLLPTDVNSLASANKNRAETVNTLQDATNKRMENAGRIGNMIMSGASVDEVARQADAAGVPIPPEQLAKFRQDPTAFQAAGKNLIAAGMKSQDFTQPHNVSPTDAITTRAGIMAPRAPVPSTNRVIGDKEAVQSGLYEPTAAEQAQGWVRPPPGSRTSGNYAIPPAMTPGEVKSSEKLQTDAAERYGKAADNFRASQDLTLRLDMMDHAIENLNGTGWSATGTGANARMGAAKAVNSILGAIGLPAAVDPTKISSWEDLTKETTRAGFELSRTLGSREAASIVDSAIKAVPSAENSYLGAKLVSSSIRQAAQREIDYYKYATDYARSHNGSTVGADIAFNEARPPKLYAQTAIANAVPGDALAYLRQNPSLSKQFDQKYGPGMSDFILNAGKK